MKLETERDFEIFRYATRLGELQEQERIFELIRAWALVPELTERLISFIKNYSK